MHELSSVNSTVFGPAGRFERAATGKPTGTESDRTSGNSADRVEISDAARAHDPAGSTDRAFELRKARIQAEIADGTYLTDEKLDAAIERLLADL